VNSHPHLSESGNIAVVHNGIIENYTSLKKKLIERGRTFKSETDTEIIAQLLEEIYTTSDVDFEQAIRLTLKQIVGTYGLAIANMNEPDKLYVARKGSPLLLGIGDGERCSLRQTPHQLSNIRIKWYSLMTVKWLKLLKIAMMLKP
jgi:glucosamine--fructose-6-phosphate aminotransferase (isomerizing)